MKSDVDFVKLFAAENRTTVAEAITQYLLSLKRRAQGETTEKILAHPAFHEAKVRMIMEQPLALGEPLEGNFRGFYSCPVKKSFIIIYLYCHACRKNGDDEIVACSDSTLAVTKSRPKDGVYLCRRSPAGSGGEDVRRWLDCIVN